VRKGGKVGNWLYLSQNPPENQEGRDEEKVRAALLSWGARKKLRGREVSPISSKLRGLGSLRVGSCT